MRNSTLAGFLFLLILGISSCSTSRNTMISRTYHQLTARYNAYHNGNESFKRGVNRVEQQYNFDYSKILPLFLYTDPTIALSVKPEMDRAISKASKVITNKSITAQPARRNTLFGNQENSFYEYNEYNRWVRESYLLAGKAHFYKHDFAPATQAFLFITREYSAHPVSYEAKIWLARSYIERGRFNEARIILEEAGNDRTFPKEYQSKLYSTFADFYLRQERLNDALEPMRKLVELPSGRNNLIRYNYILAQILEKTGNLNEAAVFYSKVTSMNPVFEMEFNAKLKLAAVFDSDSDHPSSIISNLERMLRDEKNRDFQDQIYYTIGNLYLRINDYQNSINSFSLSAALPQSNLSQKSMSYLALGGIYLQFSDYQVASAYYDSAIINMPSDFQEIDLISEKAVVLRDLSDNLNTFLIEDSLQLLASLNRNDLDRRIEEIIATDIKLAQELRDRENSSVLVATGAASASRQRVNDRNESVGASWYFYNQSAINFGAAEFESVWGSRQLGDNWRRSGQNSMVSDQLIVSDFQEQNQDQQPQSTGTESLHDSYLANIPLTPEALKLSDLKIEQALYNIGTIFSERLNNDESSTKYFEKLTERYPEGELALYAYYNLHLIHLRAGQFQLSENYKNIIVDKFPQSAHASVLTNPQYLNELESVRKEMEQFYEETLNLFRDNQFAETIRRSLYAIAEWPESSLLPWFEYLLTLSKGHEVGLDEFKLLLKDFISRHPETEMAINATEIIAYYESDFTETAVTTRLAVTRNIYTFDQSDRFSYVLITENRPDLINRLIFNMVNFNVDYFAGSDLNVAGERFASNYNLIRVTGLNDIKEAFDYYRRITVSNEIFSDAQPLEYYMFIISEENYKMFLADRNLGTYMDFFNENFPELK